MIESGSSAQGAIDVGHTPSIAHERGALPSDWRLCTLGELETSGDIRLFRGKIISQRDINRNPGDYPIYSSSVHSNGLFGRYGDYMFDEELITWSVDGGGDFFFRPKHRFSVTNVCGYMRIHTSDIDYRFLAFQLQQMHSSKSFDYTLKAHPSVIRDSYAVPLPPIAEQRAIAEALSDVDGLLGALEALIAKKRAIKRAAMQQLLTGTTRLPGFTGDWETKRLGELAAIRNQKVLPAMVDPETPCVELEHIGQGDGRLLDYSTARCSSSTKYRFLAGDVLFGRLRPYLRKFWHAGWNGICTTEIWPLAVDPKQVLSGFLRAVVEMDRFIDTASVSYGTHMPRADWGVVQNFEVHLPSVIEQAAIATVISDMDAEIAAIGTRRDKTCAVKKGMMQQLLTGRVRLVEPSPEEASP